MLNIITALIHGRDHSYVISTTVTIFSRGLQVFSTSAQNSTADTVPSYKMNTVVVFSKKLR